MRTKTLLSTAALALVISAGAVAQSVRGGEPLQSPQTTNHDNKSQPAAQPNSGAQINTQQGSNDGRKNVRTVYPNQTGPQQSQQSSQSQPAQRPNQSAPAPQQSAQQPTSQQSSQQPASQQSAQQPAPQHSAQQPTSQQSAQPSPQPSGTAQSTPPAGSTQQPATAAQQNQPQQSGQAAQPRGQQSAQQNGQSKSVVALNAQAQTRIGETISRHHVKPLTNVNFSISIGTAVPRSVQLRALPSDIVSFVPQYRGFSYFVVEEQIVIVDPASHEIAAIVPYAGATSRTATTSVRHEAPARHTAAAPTNSKAVKLDTEQREIIRKHVTRERSTSAAPAPRKHYSPGDRVSRSVTIETLPETVYKEVPPVRRYRYFNEDNDVILVDPDDDRAVDVIR